MLRLAMPVCDDRIATVLDFSREFLLVEFDHYHEVRRSEVTLHEAEQLGHLGVHVLICGAVSRSLAALLIREGIDIVPLVSGPIEEVLASYVNGRLGDMDFLLPGCASNARGEWKAQHPTRKHFHLSP